MPTPQELLALAQKSAGSTATANAENGLAAATPGAADSRAVDDNQKPLAAPVTATRKYQFPSAPSTFIQSNGVIHTAHDGVLETDDPLLIKELEAAVRVGNIYHYGEQLPLDREALARLVPPPPVGTLA